MCGQNAELPVGRVGNPTLIRQPMDKRLAQAQIVPGIPNLRVDLNRKGNIRNEEATSTTQTEVLIQENPNQLNRPV